MNNYPEGVSTFSTDAPWNNYQEPTPEEKAWEAVSEYDPLELCSSLEYALRELLINHYDVYKAYFQEGNEFDALVMLKKIGTGFTWLQVDSQLEKEE